MEENEISRCVIGAAIDVHKHLARISQCAVKGAFSQWVKRPPGNCRSSR